MVSFLLVGCASNNRPILSTETIPVESDLSVEEGGPETIIADEDTVENDFARVLVTPGGIVVPVLVDLGDSYIVSTPCGASTTVETGTPYSSVDLVLDPGHGGKRETGSVGFNDLTEKSLNLDVAMRTAELLEDRGISVLLTRTSDYQLPIVTRAEIADRLKARAVVSIHHNAPNANPSSTPGTEMFVQYGSRESRRLGGLLWEEVVDALSGFDIAWTSAQDAGAVVVLNEDGGNAYGMVRRPNVPAVLAELGYLSNPEEAELFETDEYRDAVSLALADGLERWLTTSESGGGFVAKPRVFTPSGLTGGIEGCVDPDLG